jgi:hypothetical protein
MAEKEEERKSETKIEVEKKNFVTLPLFLSLSLSLSPHLSRSLSLLFYKSAYFEDGSKSLAQKKMSSKGGWEGIDKGGICITQCRILSSFVNFKRRRY